MTHPSRLSEFQVPLFCPEQWSARFAIHYSKRSDAFELWRTVEEAQDSPLFIQSMIMPPINDPMALTRLLLEPCEQTLSVALKQLCERYRSPF